MEVCVVIELFSCLNLLTYRPNGPDLRLRGQGIVQRLRTAVAARRGRTHAAVAFMVSRREQICDEVNGSHRSSPRAVSIPDTVLVPMGLSMQHAGPGHELSIAVSHRKHAHRT